jgi:hypothetical protein
MLFNLAGPGPQGIYMSICRSILIVCLSFMFAVEANSQVDLAQTLPAHNASISHPGSTVQRSSILLGSVQSFSHFRSSVLLRKVVGWGWFCSWFPWGPGAKRSGDGHDFGQPGHLQIALRTSLGCGNMPRRAATSISAGWPSGNAPTTRVRRRISRISPSSGLLARRQRQCSGGMA